MPDDSIAELRAEWLTQRDGATGDLYGAALEAAERSSEARVVYRELIKSGYLVGYLDLAWLENARGKHKQARKLLRKYLALDDEVDEQTDLVAGILGVWIWDHKEDPRAEGLLRRGITAYPDARADLALLLRATGRTDEAETVLREGVDADDIGSFIVLGNLLSETDRADEAESFYRRGYALGDAFCAYNLCILLLEDGRIDEAHEWLRRAADGGDAKAIARLATGDKWQHPPR